jgi:HTH-type transcriptional regulator/antitoxin HipB
MSPIGYFSRNVTDRLLFKMLPIGYTAFTMKIKTPADIGALIRQRRTSLGLDQETLAARVGTSRKWLVEVEKGKPGAALGLVLRTLRQLGVTLEEAATPAEKPAKVPRAKHGSDNLNVFIDSLRRK